jgi:hypothetical protein
VSGVSPLAYRLQNLPANGMQRLVPKEMYQTLLTNKKARKNYLVHAAHNIKKYYLNGKKGVPGKSKNQPRLLFRLRSIHIVQYGDPVPLKTSPACCSVCKVMLALFKLKRTCQFLALSTKGD